MDSQQRGFQEDAMYTVDFICCFHSNVDDDTANTVSSSINVDNIET